MYQFAGATLTKYHNLSGLNKFIVEARNPRSRCQEVHLLITERKNLVHASPLNSGTLLKIFGISLFVEESKQAYILRYWGFKIQHMNSENTFQPIISEIKMYTAE